MNNLYFKRVIRTSALLFSGVLMSFNSVSYSQSITLKGNKIPFSQVVNAIRQQSGYSVFSPKALLDEVGFVSIDAQNMPLDDFLKTVLANKAITYQVEDRTISITRKIGTAQGKTVAPIAVAVQQQKAIKGFVVDADTGDPMRGVTVRVKGQANDVLTDAKGAYNLLIPADIQNPVLSFSYIGMKSVEVVVKNQTTINISLTSNVESIKEAVVTGIYQRKKESFSGSAATYTAKELKMIGNQSILQSLKTLDPSFAITENNLFGSDPNRLPDVEIRGKSSVIGLTEEFSNNPNQPLFILDGFETTIRIISDFNMDRIESITLLKDAAATAIYGSKAANGVVVVETKRPIAGQLRINYNLNSSVTFADLSDYNLMNAAEKLEYERLSRFYGGLDGDGNILNEANEVKYYNRLKEVERGVNTYWVNEPIRTALSQTHNIFAEGGDATLRYSASLSYGDTKGVMKGSSRGVTNGNVRLVYRNGNVAFTNSLNIDHVVANRESIPFSRFARANPYHRKYNSIGGVDKLMESFLYANPANLFQTLTMNVYNPMYDMNNNNLNSATSQGFTNNFEIEWRILNELRFRTRVGVRQSTQREEEFRSPFNSEFVEVDELRKGTFNEANSKNMNYDGDISLTYGKLLKEQHMLNMVAGLRVDQGTNLYSSYGVRGFADDEFSNPTFAYGYPVGSRPGYQEAKRRSASLFFNTGYSYDNRYLVDGTVRADGSSVYGADKQFTTIWSVGLAWNMHNESFIKESDLDWLNILKIRGSIGNPGNQNFNDYISMRVYRYNNDNRNPFGSSVVLNNFGNSGLKWQKTLDRNIGFDLELLNRRLRFNFDYFNKKTDPLLVFMGLPSSTGTTRMPQNLGGQITKGLTLIADYNLIRKQDYNWRVSFNMRKIKSTYQNMGSSLDKFNQDNKSRNLVRYYDGGSPSDLWAVRSAGIDPATGREIFLTKEGQQTFVHNYDDEVVVGNSDPKVEGVIGTNFFYKGFTAGVYIRYRIGGQVFMQTLYDKVENVSVQNIALNQDKRALYDRWKKPGDIAKFRAISQTDYTPMSSRFVADNNVLAGESFSMGYETSNKTWLRKIGASSINARAYMNDIFRVSTVKNERGIDYPFARSVSFSLGLRF